MDRNNYALSRLDVVLAENKQLKRRLEVVQRDNRELKISVYELSARLSVALARNQGASGHPGGSTEPPHTGSSVTAAEMAAKVTEHVLSSVASAPLTSKHGLDGLDTEKATSPPADGRHLAPSATLSGHAGAVYAVSFAPSGRLLASGSFDKSVRCWALDEMEPRETLCLQKHTHNVSTLAWSADARLLLSGSYDHTVRIWDVEAASCARIWHAPEAAFVQAIACHPTSPNVLAAATTGYSLLVFDARKPGDAPALTLPNGSMINACLFLPAGMHCVTGDKHGALKAWDLRTSSCVAGMYCGEARKPISHVALSDPVPPSSRVAAYSGVGASLSGAGHFSAASAGSGHASVHGGSNGGGLLGGLHGIEPRLLAVNSYDDTLRIYDRGYAPLESLTDPAEDGITPLDEPSTRTESLDGNVPMSRGQSSDIGGEAMVSAANSPAPAANGRTHASAGTSAHGSIGLEVEEGDGEGTYAPCVYALVGHRNRSYPIRSAMHVGAEYARAGSTARRAAVVDVTTSHDDDGRHLSGGSYHGTDLELLAPTIHSTVLVATGSADGDAYVYDIGSSAGACAYPRPTPPRS